MEPVDASLVAEQCASQRSLNAVDPSWAKLVDTGAADPVERVAEACLDSGGAVTASGTDEFLCSSMFGSRCSD